MAVTLGAQSEAQPRSATETPGRYRPHLDGLRAVAVYLVVLFHAGAARFSGGFIGVDVFFVLSGYLVTQLLMRDLTAGGGVRFGRFYARRMRRLLPASAVLLLVTAVVYSAIASPAEIASVVGSFKAAFLYVANWFFINQSSDYFARDIETNPVIHFWSLAIEEQFYFVWPVLLGALYAGTRRLRDRAQRAMQVVVAGAGLASLAWALSLATDDINRAYYGTDARAYQLLAGALLALSPGIIRRVRRMRGAPVVAALALAALVALATSLFDLSVIRRGVAAVVVTAVLIIAIEAVQAGPVNRLLSCGPAVYLGKISYGTYLWHWPVILVALSVTDERISPLSLFAVAALVATGIASLSYTILERPIREQKLLDRLNPVVIITGLGVSVVCALVLIPAILDPYGSSAAPVRNPSAGLTPVPTLDFATARVSAGPDLRGVAFVENCHGKPAAACTVVKGRGDHVLIIGDSHAQMMFPTLAKIAQQRNLTLSTAASGGCPWQRHLYLGTATATDLALTAKCKAFKQDLYERVIPELKPDLVVAMSNDYLTRRPGAVDDDSGGVQPSSGPTELGRQIAAETQQSVDELRSTGAKVLIIDPVPATDLLQDPFVCLTKSKWLEDCRFVANTAPTPIDSVYARVADNRNVFVADFDKLVCPFMPICDPVIGGDIVRYDNQHITPFAVTLAGPVEGYLEDERLISR